MGNFTKLFVITAVVLGVLTGVGRLFAFRWWQIPDDDPVLTASITPTVHGGDWVLLWRATRPSFGALVVCPDPEDESRVVIGRLVGEEGDTVSVDGARVRINDHDAQTETTCHDITFHVQEPTNGTEVEQRCVLEEMGGVLHMKGELSGLRQPQATTRTVGEGKVFLVSDNRAFPQDSRQYGSVDRDSCKESIFFRLVSKEGFMDVKNRFTYIH